MRPTTPPTGLVLNIAPVEFSSEVLSIGRMPPIEGEAYQKLREQHWETHCFRFDNRYDEVLNVPVKAGVAPLGRQEDVNPHEYLLLIAKAIQHELLLWLSPQREILRGGKRLVFWGKKKDSSLLLSRAAEKIGVVSQPGLEVVMRYEIDCRMFRDNLDEPFLGVIIDLGTSNIIDIPLGVLWKRGLQLQGRYVCRRAESDVDHLHPSLELLGKVSRIEGTRIYLTDTEGVTETDMEELLLEPRLENFRDVIALYYGVKANQLLSALDEYRKPIATGTGKLARVRDTLTGLKGHQITLGDDFPITLGDLLSSADEQFPSLVSTERPTLLFGPQGRKSGTWPDLEIERHGPFMYMLHERNRPHIAVICEAQNLGRVEQFIKMLREGVPDELWPTEKRNPFTGGLLGKFRLADVQVTYETCANSSADAYRAAASRILNRLPERPDLAIIQIRDHFKQLYGDANPYYVSKAAFMMAGVPTQAINLFNLDKPPHNLAYILNNIALAIYAKLDGIPWVMSTPGPTTHELVLGLGATEVRRGRLGERSRYVGITTLFQGDGRYLLWGATREVEFERYAEALLNSLRTTVQYVKQQNAWRRGDKIRLVCHVYKRLRDLEVEAIKALVNELAEDDFLVEFAFLDISWHHPYHVFAPSAPGVNYYDWEYRKHLTKGKGVPERGLCLQLDQWSGLLQLIGPRELKTRDQGIPSPLLIQLHRDSDYTDLVYLLRQVFHFSYMSWRSFFPSGEPITITYSRLIARLLGNLKAVSDWDSQVVTVGSLRDRRWFL